MVLLCDGWTSTNSNFQLYCLVAAYVDTSGKLQQHLVGIVDTPSARSHDLQRLFIAEMSKSKLTMDQFFCSVTDGASNLKSLAERLQVPRIHCACHVLHLVVVDITRMPDVAPIVEKCKKNCCKISKIAET
uniref:Dimer_Tnp_hAT domain-containing protein n=1 Tax=Caenorhabditis japonica TaxID=281687 RepID=A0A8R1EFN4_CAEJA